MKKNFTNKLFIFSVAFMLCSCIPFMKNTKKVVKPDTAQNLINATVRLGAKMEVGERIVDLCSATAIKKTGTNKYMFLTAAHCVSVYNEVTEEIILLTSLVPIKFVLSVEAEGDGEPTVFEAKLLAYGDRTKFEDVAILEAETDLNFDLPLIYGGREPLKIKEELGIAVAPIDNMGNLYLVAYVSKPGIKVDYMVAGMNIKGAIPIQVIGLGIGRGSSGSSVMSVEKNAIIGVISTTSVNGQGHVTLSLCPISKFHDFYAKYENGETQLPKVEADSSVCESPTLECIKLLNSVGIQIKGP